MCQHSLSQQVRAFPANAAIFAVYEKVRKDLDSW